MRKHMGDYRPVVSVEQSLVYATPTRPLLYQHSDLWRTPRGTVLRIQALTLVAIALSFFLAVFGSCRRWSNHWIVQKGFSAAQVLSLSLGTYSIGLMQSSSVKSEMYPIWAVSLLTLLGCMDPVTSTSIGLDYTGLLLQVIFQLCLYSGYILLMSASVISGPFGNIAIGVLSAITFIKGFHRSLALVLPSRLRNKLRELNKPIESGALHSGGQVLVVRLPVHCSEEKGFPDNAINMSDIRSIRKEKTKDSGKKASILENVCLGYSLSHLLRRRFLGMNTASEMEERRKIFEHRPTETHIYEDTLKAIEFELAFLYEVFFTSNEFLRYYEAKASSFWALASIIGISLVGIAAATPGAMDSRYYSNTTTVTVVVNTTTADLVVTLVILVSMALLQLVQLMACWTSNWARVSLAYELAKKHKAEKEQAKEAEKEQTVHPGNKEQSGCSIKFFPRGGCRIKWKAFVVTRMKYFDKYLWQDKLGQYSAVAAATSHWGEGGCCSIWMVNDKKETTDDSAENENNKLLDRLSEMLGLQYIRQAINDSLWFGADTNGLDAVRLHDYVKTCIAEFLGQPKSRRIWTDLETWLSSNNQDKLSEHLPYTSAPLKVNGRVKSPAYAFTHRVIVCHIATWYCEIAELEGLGTGGEGGGGGGQDDVAENRRVAMDLSKYCAYLVVSKPELLPGPPDDIKSAFGRFVQLLHTSGEMLECIRRGQYAKLHEPIHNEEDRISFKDPFCTGINCGRRLRNERSRSWSWDVLARLWVQTLLYAAPCGDVEAHMQHLAQGGEFITHLWALLYHIGVVDKWEMESGTATAGAGGDQTTEKSRGRWERETETEAETDGGDQNQTGENRQYLCGDHHTAPGTSNSSIAGNSNFWGPASYWAQPAQPQETVFGPGVQLVHPNQRGPTTGWPIYEFC